MHSVESPDTGRNTGRQFQHWLALTLVTVGVGAAISVQQVAKRWSGFNTLAKRAPYFSSLLIGLVGVYMGVHGFMGIMR